MRSIAYAVLLLSLTACSTEETCVDQGPPDGGATYVTPANEADCEPAVIPPAYVPMPDCLFAPELFGAPVESVYACGGTPCAAEVTHSDEHVTTGWILYCGEESCSDSCYWQARVYYENGSVTYLHARRP